MVRPFLFIRLRRLAAASIAAAAIPACAACTGCGPLFGPQVRTRSAGGRLAVTTWNLQALFDGVDDGAEYDEYRSGAGWTDARYRARLDALAGALRMLSEEGPDILALQEAESAAVLDAFARGPLGPWGYRWSSFAALPGASLGVGLLSRLPILSARAHGITRLGETAPRPILEVRVDAEGEDLVFFVCHWKSKLGGADATEGLRRTAAQVVARRTAELAATEPDTPVLVLGDLNENYDEYERRGRTIATALMPAPPGAESGTASGAGSVSTGGDCLFLSSEQSCFPLWPRGLPIFYSPWTSGTWGGSYAYRGEWETIDHLLFGAACFDGAGWEFSSFSVADGEPFVDDSGYPIAYNPRIGRGISDHLPLTAVLERRQ